MNKEELKQLDKRGRKKKLAPRNERKSTALSMFLAMGDITQIAQVAKTCTDKFGKGYSEAILRKFAEEDNWEQQLRSYYLNHAKKKARGKLSTLVGLHEKIIGNLTLDYTNTRSVLSQQMATAFEKDKKTGKQALKKSMHLQEPEQLQKVGLAATKVNEKYLNMIGNPVSLEAEEALDKVIELDRSSGRANEVEILHMKKEVLGKPAYASDVQLATEVEQQKRIPTSKDDDINDLWIKFINQELTARDMALELELRGKSVPPTIAMMAKHQQETELPDDEGKGDEFSSFDMDSLDKEAEAKRIQEEQEKKFVPQRKLELDQIKEDHGFSKTEKPKESVIDMTLMGQISDDDEDN